MRGWMFGLGLWMCGAVAWAVPMTVGHQGRLVEATGGNSLNGEQALTFRLYDVPTLGTPLWTEVHPAVSVADGYYAVTLGSITTLDAAALNGATRYLGVTVGGQEMAPRTSLVSVPYAIRAGVADNAGAQVATLTDGASIAVNGAAGNVFDVTLGGSRTLANPTNLVDGLLYTFRVRQGGAGGFTLSYGSNYKFEGGPPTLAGTTGDLSVLGFVAVAGKLHNVFTHRDQQCAPGTQTFVYLGSAHTFPVPLGCTTITAKMWGAGGASGEDDDYGGGGGYTRATIPVTPGENLSVIVGGAGVCSTGGVAAGGFGGGGASGGERTGSGGGRSAVRLQNTTEMVTAGGGGGGARTSGTRYGGFGGGTTGGAGAGGDGPIGGGGGTQSTGGTGGGGANGGASGITGAQFIGGDAGVTGSAYDGGGGGGGYYGGGGGGSSAHGSCCSAAGGGGGSGFAHASATNTSLVPGTASSAGNAGDSDRAGAGQGGTGGGCINGAHGRVILSWGT